MRTVATIDQDQIAEMDLDITMRMKVKEWHRFVAQQGTSYPAGFARTYITRILERLNQATTATIIEPLSEADK